MRSGGSEWRMSGEIEVVMGREKKIRSLNCLLRVPSLGNWTMDTDNRYSRSNVVAPQGLHLSRY